jgi:hypothetical protein
VRSLLLVSFFLCISIFANTFDASNSDNFTNIEKSTHHNNSSKVIYLNYQEVPSRVLKGEIFKVTLKVLSTVKDFLDITYDLSNSKGLKLLNDFPLREEDSKYYYDTFYFLATSTTVRLPDFRAILLSNNSDVQYKTTTLSGQNLNVISLNPKKDFSNIIADIFEIIEYKTTNYNDTHNIVVFVATAKNCDISALKLNDVYKQGTESIVESYFDSKITYYAIIDKKIENLSFSYFNLNKNEFVPINIPIVLIDDSVTTQSDLKPKDQSHEMLKIAFAAAIAIILFFIILLKKKYIYLVFILIPLAYIAYTGIPSKEICIKKDSKIYLLPIANGTIFETTPGKYYLKKEDEVKGWVKVQLKNKKIGWVKNEDICSH